MYVNRTGDGTTTNIQIPCSSPMKATWTTTKRLGANPSTLERLSYLDIAGRLLLCILNPLAPFISGPVTPGIRSERSFPRQFP
jgi:hypothetical protein